MQIGQTVYFITDEEQKAYIVTGIIQRFSYKEYIVSHNGEERVSFWFGLSEEKKVF